LGFGTLEGGIDRNNGVEDPLLGKRLANLFDVCSADKGAPIRLVDEKAQKTEVLVSIVPDAVDKIDGLDESLHAEGAPGLDGDHDKIGGVKGTQNKGSHVGRVVDDGEVKVLLDVLPKHSPQLKEDLRVFLGQGPVNHDGLQGGRIRNVGDTENVSQLRWMDEILDVAFFGFFGVEQFV